MSRPSASPRIRSPNAQAATPDISRSTSTTSCKLEDDSVIPPLVQGPDYRQKPSSSARIHPLDPNAWSSSQQQPPSGSLEQLTGHDLMAMFPTQPPTQLICCDDIFKSQAREFLAKQTLPSVNIQESPETLDDAMSNPSSLPVVGETRVYVPRPRRTSKVCHTPV
ncbi:hypothetical protein BC835DRAFT_191087 [Cytidiella melzeri]|nr:hypothetical protein BC835DRAFT_191087 [Cytidiella melzeri]